MDIRSVFFIKQQNIPGRVEHPVHRERKLDHAEVHPEMAARRANLLHDKGPDIGSQRQEGGWSPSPHGFRFWRWSRARLVTSGEQGRHPAKWCGTAVPRPPARPITERQLDALKNL
jgi:hypothetical protein